MPIVLVNQDYRTQSSVTRAHTQQHAMQAEITPHQSNQAPNSHVTPVTIPTFFYRGTRTDTQEKGNKHQYLGRKSDKTHVISLLTNWEMFE